MWTEQERPQPNSLAVQLREADGRVIYAERAYLALRLGLSSTDLELMPDDVITDLLNLPTAVVGTIAAARMFERVDAHVAREHPVDLEYPDPTVIVAQVSLRHDGGLLTAALQDDRSIILERDDAHVADLDVDDAESLAYALLRLVDVARKPPEDD